MVTEVMVRTYTGANQAEAAARYGEDAVRLASEGWAAASQSWVEGEWPASAYIAAFVLVIFVIGIALLILFALVKPKRTLMVTYHRAPSESIPEPAT
jgi:hypothetical protein